MKSIFSMLTPPIVWRYLLREYTKIVAICLFGIVTLFLSTRLEDVAHFIALGAPVTKIVAFILYQIPYMLQIAIPLASLVAGFTLFSNMSSSGELTALRSTGYSVQSLLTPLTFFTTLMAIVMMWGLFDVSAKSRLATKKLEFDVREDEPLTFIQNSRYFFKHGVAMELTGSLRTGQNAKDLLFCLPSRKNDRLSLIIIKQAHAKRNCLHGNYMTLLSSNPPSSATKAFGSLLVENADKKKTPIGQVHELAQKKTWSISPEYMPLAVVRAKRQHLRQEMSARLYKGLNTKKTATLIQKFTSEPFRRLSLSLAVISLYLIGAVSGIRNHRTSRRLIALIRPLFCFALFIACYLAGKKLDEKAAAAIAFYLLVHLFLIVYAYRRKNKLELGME